MRITSPVAHQQVEESGTPSADEDSQKPGNCYLCPGAIYRHDSTMSFVYTTTIFTKKKKNLDHSTFLILGSTDPSPTHTPEKRGAFWLKKRKHKKTHLGACFQGHI
jgi:hypothetical protein